MRKTKVKKEKQKSLENMKGKTAGITLIALVITIIVLLILAGVSIATLTGDNGILTQAGNAKTQNSIGEEKEAIKIAYNGAKIVKQGGSVVAEDLNSEFAKNGTDAEATGTEPITVTFGSGNKYTIDVNGIITGPTTGEVTGGENIVDGVKIPDGFYHVARTTKNDGLVISDVQGDDLENTKQGNQFVWVPVNFSEFTREHFGTTDQKWWTGTFVTDKLTDNSMYEPTADGIASTTEVEKMYKSVKDNGGFYIARFEAGKDSNGNVIVKKGANVYNNVKWNSKGDMDDTSTEGIGALELSRNFASSNGYTSVTSTLCYGVQWDAVMRWMKDIPNPNVSGKTYVQDSTGMGHYDSSSKINTGSNDNYDVKNIYDMAGNVYEWTMESYDTFSRVGRGGGYDGAGSYDPSSDRYFFEPSSSSVYVGFRLTLYL